MKLKTNILPKLLEALGIAALMIAFVTGVYGDQWGELYLFLGGILAFIIGRHLEKRWERRNVTMHETNPIQ
ncbi:MAG: hypothetical protein HYR76_03850 [Ignavibacteria bacterium]|nr:hypothetical protein [Ignavibacteria bacterium]MBI3765138.1 hypothetical protein [Ignavibacteriales bacterium]